MGRESRREFLARAAAGAAAMTGLGSARALGANEVLRVGAIGCGGRGTSLARAFQAMEGVRVAYACDPDEERAERAAASIGGTRPWIATDMRKVFDDRDVDAVSIATPDHWHAPAAILACEAGKHVYVEKPCSHNVREGRLLVEAARRGKRVVQHGTQSRTHPMVVQGIRALRAGIIGHVIVAKAWNVQYRAPIGRETPSDPPPGVDYDLWVGPAPFVPYQKNRFHYTWHWWFNFGTGDMGNDGSHELDIARWGLGVETHPAKVSGSGGKFAYDDDQEFPDTQYVEFEYPGDGTPGSSRQLVYEQRLWSPYGVDGIDNGNAFYGTKGWMLLSKRGILKVFDERGRPIEVKEEKPDFRDHQADFVHAVRTGGTPQAEIEIGHLSAALCHLGNLAVRVGRSFRFDAKTETIPGDAEANALVRRRYRDHWAAPRRG
ncbi:MAG: Gfo/Idh/MocA family oxidoreductase [Planctomycetes bacterium]|nr:Gfo/Idh/MocA family oxidoreductase [Planctomycetota bacterium]